MARSNETPITPEDISTAHILCESLEDNGLKLKFYPNGIILVMGKDSHGKTISPPAYDVVLILSALKEKGHHINNVYHLPYYANSETPTCVVIDCGESPH